MTSTGDAPPDRRHSRPILVSVGVLVLVALAGGIIFAATRTEHRRTSAVTLPRVSPSRERAPHHRQVRIATSKPAHRPSARTSRTTSSTATPRPVLAGRLLAGVVVGVDPGHNGGNFMHVAHIDHLIWNGRENEACNTTGTETDSGYTEAGYNFKVASYLADDLRKAGATVVMTRTSNTGVGPCVNRRAEIINASHAAVAIDIHADGGPPAGRGFTVLEPVADGVNNRVVAQSRRYGALLRDAFETTGMPTSTYDGTDGINYRDDLAGLNLTTVPQVLIETGNMRNAEDAALLTSAVFQRKAARAIMLGMVRFLGSEHR
jgi:N-acetylmuramoyl-L-alanine amidase